MTTDNDLAGQKLPLKERFSYGMLDTAGQLVFTMISSYLLYFYTDVAQIPIAAAGLILLLARIFDGIDAPIWGAVIDMTNSKYGKARPYFLWLAVPFSLFGILTFWAPDLDADAKIWYCAITYIITGIIYTGSNTPLTAILPLLTRNPVERLRLNSYRMTGSQIGVLIVNAMTLPLVAFFGGGDDVAGFRYTIVLFAVVSCLLNLYAFSNLRERVHVAQERVPLKKSVKAIKNNWPWVIIVVSNFFFWIALTERTSTLVYYFIYNIDNKAMVTFLNSIASLQILGMLAVPYINKYVSKCNIWLCALALAIIGQIVIIAAGTNLSLITAGWIVANLGSGVACSMPFALLGSAVDYGKYKNGVHAAGLLTALGTSFCLKVGSGIAGFLPTVIMGFFNYVPGQAQTAESLTGISLSFNYVTIIAFAIAAVPLFFYRKYEAMEGKIRAELLKQEIEQAK